MTYLQIAFRQTAFLALILSAPLFCAPAQAQLEELAGRRVRLSLVRAPGGISTSPVGVLTELTADSLVLSAEDEIVSIPRRDIQRLDVSTGTRRMTAQGALAGLAMGAFGLGALAATTNDSDSCNNKDGWFCIEFSDAEVGAAGAIVGGVLGAVLGAVIGSSMRSDRWQRVDLKVTDIAAAPGRSFMPVPSVRLVISI